MQLINGYWTDDRGNRWSQCFYTRDAAVEASATLTNCNDCDNCIGCRYCRYCHNCHDCIGCRYCTDCHNCHYCHNCTNCTNCRDCHNCHDCNGYVQQPQSYTSQRMGSRNDITYIYYGQTASGMEHQVVCGCFRGNLDQFSAKVIETHGDNQFAQDYLKVIAKARVLFDL